MILQQMIEEVRMIFPDRPRVQVIMDLNRKHREFCERTSILRQRAALDWATYLKSRDAKKSEYKFSYPDGLFEILEIDALYNDDYEIVGNRIICDHLPSDADPIVVYYAGYPATLVADIDEPAMPVEFHEALPVGVLMSYARIYGPNQKAWQIYQLRWEELVAEAMKWRHRWKRKNIATTATAGAIVPGVSNGKFWSKRYPLVDGLNTVDMSPDGVAFSAADSYRIMINGNGIYVSEYDPNSNYDQRTVNSFKVLAAGDAPMNEFLVTGT